MVNVLQFMLHVLDVRDAMDSERFQQVQFDPVNDAKNLARNATAVAVGAAGAVVGADAESKESSKWSPPCDTTAFETNMLMNPFLSLLSLRL